MSIEIVANEQQGFVIRFFEGTTMSNAKVHTAEHKGHQITVEILETESHKYNGRISTEPPFSGIPPGTPVPCGGTFPTSEEAEQVCLNHACALIDLQR